jgi:hypothetical protein
MKKPLLYILAIPICFLLAACPYESKVPISNPGIQLNAMLFGTWLEKTDSSTIYEVSDLNKFTYKIVEKHKDNSESKQYLAFPSTVNGTTFLNLWEDKPGENNPTYLLYKLDVVNSNSILLLEVTENIDEQFTSSEQLKKYISSNMKNSYFFSKEETELVRVGQ